MQTRLGGTEWQTWMSCVESYLGNLDLCDNLGDRVSAAVRKSQKLNLGRSQDRLASALRQEATSGHYTCV